MHDIEPHYHWRHLYTASEDPQSPFYGREYSEFEYTSKIYNYYIHPQWDDMGSETLFIKILFCDYEESFTIIELIGEWNDAIGNDIMIFKRDIIDLMLQEGIKHFILIGENVLNFHASDDSYYEEWLDDVEEGWIVALQFRPHVQEEFNAQGLDQYVLFGGRFDSIDWRTHHPRQLFQKINNRMRLRLH